MPSYQSLPTEDSDVEVEFHDTELELENDNDNDNESTPLVVPESTNDNITVVISSEASESNELPAYDTANTTGKLPTYDEYEETNVEESATHSNSGDYMYVSEAVVPGFGIPLGDDVTFCVTFFVAFFLNWIGFLFSYFFSRTLAGRCGATSGFGLGLIRLSFDIRNRQIKNAQEHVNDGANEQVMVW
eukprot:Pgem_evm1s12853